MLRGALNATVVGAVKGVPVVLHGYLANRVLPLPAGAGPNRCVGGARRRAGHPDADAHQRRAGEPRAGNGPSRADRGAVQHPVAQGRTRRGHGAFPAASAGERVELGAVSSCLAIASSCSCRPRQPRKGSGDGAARLAMVRARGVDAAVLNLGGGHRESWPSRKPWVSTRLRLGAGAPGRPPHGGIGRLLPCRRRASAGLARGRPGSLAARSAGVRDPCCGDGDRRHGRAPGPLCRADAAA